MSVNYIDKSTGDLIRVAGQGKAEYGASTVRRGTFTGTDNGTGLINITVTFDTPMPDADYLVEITDVSSVENFWVSVAAKTKNGFALYLRKSTGGSSITVDGTYTAFKLYTDTEYNNLLNNAVLTSDVTDSITNGDMNPVTSNAVYDAITDLTPVDAVTNGNMKPVTSNAVYDAIAPIGTQVAGYFYGGFNAPGQHNTNLTLTEGTWLVIMTLLTGQWLSGDMYMTAGGIKVSGYIRESGSFDKNAALDAIVTVGAGATKVIGMYQANGAADVNGDANYWYVNAYRLK